MSTRSRTSSLVENDIVELSTLTKTGYTYAKSRSYRQQVTPDRIIPPPNMSRNRVAHEEVIGNRDGNTSRASSVGSHYSTHSYYLRSGTGSPGLDEEESSSRLSHQRKQYPVSPSGRDAFQVPRGLDHESDSSPEYIPRRRRSVTPLATTSDHRALNGRASLTTEPNQRLTPLGEEEEEEEVTIIRRIIKVCNVYNERIIRYVANTVSPPLPAPPDVAASSLPVGVGAVQRKTRGWRWLWWLLLPLALALLYVPASNLYKDQIVKDSKSVQPPSVPIVLPSDGVSEAQKQWVQSVLESRINDALLNFEGRIKHGESEKIALKEDMEARFQELANLLSALQSDLSQSKAAIGVLSEKTADIDHITELGENMTVAAAALESQKQEITAVGGALQKLKVDLESIKSCCRNNELIVGLADAIAVIQTKQDAFENIIAGLKNDQKLSLEAEIEKVRGEFKRQLDLMEITLRAEADSTRVVLMKEVATQAAAHAVAAVAAKTTEVSVDGVSEQFVSAAIAEALAKYDADKIGMADFALESAGGEIASVRCTETYTRGMGALRLFGIPLWYPTNNPRIAIQRGVNPGECWAFRGDKGFLVVKLARPIRINAVTIEHISKSVSLTNSVDTAPRNFTVLALRELQDPTPRELGNFIYDSDKSPLQTFYILDDVSREAYPYVELRITSNHGNKDYTCLYRFRVHGIPATED